MSNENNDNTHGRNEPHFDGDGAVPEGHDADAPDSLQEHGPTINSINAVAKKSNKAARALIVVAVIGTVAGISVFLGTKWVTEMKNMVQASSKHRKGEQSPDSPNSLNPESTTGGGKSGGGRRALGADGETPAPMGSAAANAGAMASYGADDVRPIRDDSGKIVVNAQGKAMGVDAKGRVVEVPAIATVDGTEPRTKKPLPGQSNVAGSGQGTAGGGQPEKKPPSRYGGALLIDGLTPAVAQASAASETAASKQASAEQRTYDLVNAILHPRGQETAPSSTAVGAASGQEGATKQSAGPVGSQLTSSRTAVAVASRMPDQTLLLPKNRQGDCILTTRIINELPGFTSCTLTQNLWGADGKVILLERGSEISGEYGVSNQTGQRRLFVVWTRARTPEGVQIDLESPATDPLGTSGVPGYLEQRWSERIGAALLLSVMKDAIALAMERAQPANTSGSVVVQPGQNTLQTGQDLADQVLKQTINVKPTLYINEGTRVSVFVARDLDFSSVYALKTVATRGADSSGGSQ